MTEIVHPPCAITVATETRGFTPCPGRQAIRALVEKPQCDHAEPFAPPVTTFEAWMVSRGLKPSTAALYAGIVASLRDRSIVTVADFPPGLKESTVRVYANALGHWERYQGAAL